MLERNKIIVASSYNGHILGSRTLFYNSPLIQYRFVKLLIPECVSKISSVKRQTPNGKFDFLCLVGGDAKQTLVV